MNSKIPPGSLIATDGANRMNKTFIAAATEWERVQDLFHTIQKFYWNEMKKRMFTDDYQTAQLNELIKDDKDGNMAAWNNAPAAHLLRILKKHFITGETKNSTILEVSKTDRTKAVQHGMASWNFKDKDATVPHPSLAVEQLINRLISLNHYLPHTYLGKEMFNNMYTQIRDGLQTLVHQGGQDKTASKNTVPGNFYDNLTKALNAMDNKVTISPQLYVMTLVNRDGTEETIDNKTSINITPLQWMWYCLKELESTAEWQANHAQASKNLNQLKKQSKYKVKKSHGGNQRINAVKSNNDPCNDLENEIVSSEVAFHTKGGELNAEACIVISMVTGVTPISQDNKSKLLCFECGGEHWKRQWNGRSYDLTCPNCTPDGQLKPDFVLTHELKANVALAKQQM
ncbi:MAG TPA: hypothetical protein EYO59_12290, partial [Chromatiaceae bacterium]|nr:hypothetical protein [Chromatiaceae bacterium]